MTAVMDYAGQIKMESNKLIKLGLATLLVGTMAKNVLSDSINVGVNYEPNSFSIVNAPNPGKEDENTKWRNYVGNNWENFAYPDAKQDFSLSIDYRKDADTKLLDSLKAKVNFLFPTSSQKVYSKDYLNPASGSFEFDMDKTENINVSGFSLGVAAERKVSDTWSIELGLGALCHTFDYSMSEETDEVAGLYRLHTKDTSGTKENQTVYSLEGSIKKEFSGKFSVKAYFTLLSESRKQLSNTVNTATTEDLDTSDGIAGTVTTDSYNPESGLYVSYPQSRIGVNVTYSFALKEKEKSEIEKLIEADDFSKVVKYVNKNYDTFSRKEKREVKKYLEEHNYTIE